MTYQFFSDYNSSNTLFFCVLYFTADCNSHLDKELQQKRFHDHFVKKKVISDEKIRIYTADYIANIYSALI